MFFVIKPDFSNESRFIRRGDGTPLVQQTKNAEWIVIDQFDNFDIIFEINLPEFVFQLFCNKMLLL